MCSFVLLFFPHAFGMSPSAVRYIDSFSGERENERVREKREKEPKIQQAKQCEARSKTNRTRANNHRANVGDAKCMNRNSMRERKREREKEIREREREFPVHANDVCSDNVRPYFFEVYITIIKR